MHFAKKLCALIILSFFSIPALAQLTADFAVSTGKGCAPILVQFTDKSGGNPNSWLWDFGNGNTSSVQNPSAIYVNSGKYTVKLVISDGNNSDSILKTEVIIVLATPQVNFSASDTVGCLPLTVQFTDLTVDTAASLSSWLWDFGDGEVSTDQHPSHEYTIPGEHTVFLIATSSKGCRSYHYKTRYIDVRKPIAKIDATTATCLDSSSVQFRSASLGKNLSYTWDFDDGNTSTSKDPVHPYLAKGVYNVKLNIEDDAGCKASTTHKVEVVDFDLDFSFTVECKGYPYQYIAYFTEEADPFATAWLWDFGDGKTSTDPNPVHFYYDYQPKTITLKAFSGPNCSQTVSKVYTPLVPAYEIDTNSSCTSPLNSNFTNLTVGSGDLDFLWDLNGSSSADSNTAETFLKNINLKFRYIPITLTASDTLGCTITTYDTLHIGAPDAMFSFNNIGNKCPPKLITFKDISQHFDSIAEVKWTFGDGFTGTGDTIAHYYTSGGNLTVKMVITDIKGCVDSIEQIVVLGVKPDSMNIIASFVNSCVPMDDQADTLCYGSTYSFQSVVTYADTTIKPNFYSWFPSSRPSKGFVIGTPKSGVGVSYNTEDLTFGHDTIALVAGFNNCLDTFYFPYYVAPPRSKVCLFDTLGNPVQNWGFCAGPVRLNLLNCSDGADSVGTFTMTHLQTNTQTLLNPDDTNSLFLNKAGHYKIELNTWNDTIQQKGCGNCNDQFLITIDSVRTNTQVTPNPQCTSNNVLFNRSINSLYGSLYNTTWVFGDGNFANSNTTTHSFDAAGIYDVRVTSSVRLNYNKGFGGKQRVCVYTDTTVLQINGPAPDFKADTVFACLGQVIQFGDSSFSATPIKNWIWNFGDGSAVSTQQHPAHAYTKTGIFSVTLRVTDQNNCQALITKPGYIIITQPSAKFVLSDDSICSGETIDFTNISSGFISSIIWDMDNGDTLTDFHTSYTYLTAGIYNPVLTVIDVNGCSDNTSGVEEIVVLESPIASFTVDTVMTDCPPLVANFVNTSTGDSISFLWDFGDSATSVAKDPTKLYTNSGVYPITLAVTNKLGCSDTFRLPNPIEVNGPVASFTFEPDTGCVPMHVEFKAESKNVALYVWDFGDGRASLLTHENKGYKVKHVYSEAGVYQPFLFVKNFTGCLFVAPLGDKIRVVDLDVKPQVDLTICDEGPVRFSVDFDESIEHKLNWNFGDSTSSSQVLVLHNYPAFGKYVASLEIETDYCTFEQNFPIELLQGQDILFNVDGDEEILCAPYTLDYEAIRLDGALSNKLNWNWGDGTTSSDSSGSYTYQTAGKYLASVSYSYENGKCVVDSSFELEIGALPDADFEIISLADCITSNDFQFVPKQDTLSPVNFLWRFSEGAELTEKTPRVSFDNSGEHSVTLILSDELGCADSMIRYLEVEDTNSFKIGLPNAFSPAPLSPGINDHFKIKNLPDNSEIIIYTRWGEKIFESQNYQNDFDGAGIPINVFYYILKICDENVYTGWVQVFRP